MPATAKGLKVDKPFDPRENIIGGVKYIKGLMAWYGIFGWRWQLITPDPGPWRNMLESPVP